MKEHLAFKVKAHKNVVKTPTTTLSDSFKNGDNKGIWTSIGNAGKALSELMSNLVIWKNVINNIEGEFGSGVGSFFRFLRLLLALNTISSVLRY